MNHGSELPDGIDEAVQLIQALQNKSFLTRAEKENLNRAKLRIAFWACRSENIVASRENLSYVLGADASEIMAAYDKYLERDDGKADGRGAGSKDGKSGKTQFWKNG